MTQIRVRSSGLKTLGDKFRFGSVIGLLRGLERGEQIMRVEVPFITGNLRQGVTSEAVVTGRKVEGKIIASARSGRTGGGTATLHGANGKTREVKLRPQPARNYAADVALGTGEYGPNGTPIVPKRGKALLVPVTDGASLTGESYLEINGRFFVLRRRVKGRKPDPFHERTAARLERELPTIFEAALRQELNR